MHIDAFGAEEDSDLVWVMGFGNKADSRHERWLIDQLVAAGYQVHAVELPTNNPDFDAGYRQPVRTVLEDLQDPSILSHSMGGLVTAHLGPDAPTVYLSPWWGTDLPGPLRILLRVPTTLRFLPSGVSAEGLGELADPADVTAPGRVSPAWLRTMVEAQAALPPIDPEATVFYSEQDEVVDVDAIRDNTEPDQRELYDSGHELFSSAGREAHVERVIEALDSRE